jgi:hypothetical protein
MSYSASGSGSSLVTRTLSTAYPFSLNPSRMTDGMPDSCALRQHASHLACLNGPYYIIIYNII